MIEDRRFVAEEEAYFNLLQDIRCYGSFITNIGIRNKMYGLASSLAQAYYEINGELPHCNLKSPMVSDDVRFGKRRYRNDSHDVEMLAACAESLSELRRILEKKNRNSCYF